MHHSDKTLSKLCQMLINRDLFKIKIQRNKFQQKEIDIAKKKIKEILEITDEESSYFVFQDNIINNAYSENMDKINILLKNGETLDIKEATDTFSISALATPVEKWFLCYPETE
jgi:hypothetical protein